MLFSFYKVALLLSALPRVLAATTSHNESFVPDAVLRVTAENRTQSCLPSKSVVLVNGTSPGPELRLKEGNCYWIRVYNDMPDANTTMHWHGLSMAVSPFADGTPLASQWPIPPLHYFDYEICIEIGMAGTFFYHSHVGFQAVSAAGPLIVEDCEVPYHYDEERIIFLSDVFAKNDSTIESGLVQSPLVWSGESAMILVNGQGGGTSNGTVCNASLSTIDVEPGKTYRLRFIGGTALTYATLAFEGHDCMTVIEADGSYTQPHTTSHLQVGAGQRYSVLLDTHMFPTKQQFLVQIESRERPTVTRGYAVLNYGAKPATAPLPPTQAPLSLPNQTYGFLDYELRPFYQRDIDEFPTADQVTRRVIIDVHQSVRGRTVWLNNGSPWTEAIPAEPYLVSLYKNDGVEFPSMERALANNGLDPVADAFPAQIGEVIEIIIQNTGADAGGLDAHPWHIHGKHAYDCGAGNGTFNATANEILLAGRQPVKRDTTVLYRYEPKTTNGTDVGWRAWRIKISQTGVWMVHCHILQHMLMGMQTVWVMGNETELLGRVPRPEVEGYLTYGGNVYGNESHYPEVVEFNDAWASNQR